jgi:hypothetical protein
MDVSLYLGGRRLRYIKQQHGCVVPLLCVGLAIETAEGSLISSEFTFGR